MHEFLLSIYFTVCISPFLLTRSTADTIKVAVIDLSCSSNDDNDADADAVANALAVAFHAMRRDYNGSSAPALVAVGSDGRDRRGGHGRSALGAVCRGLVAPSALVLLCADARFPVPAAASSAARGRATKRATSAAAAAVAAAPAAKLESLRPLGPLGHLSAPLLAVFGGADPVAGCTARDAHQLEAALGQQPQVRDWRVLSMPARGHAFAHSSSSSHADDCAPPWAVDDDAGDALLLLTAWLDLYNRPVIVD
jgi:hypothetical protein